MPARELAGGNSTGDGVHPGERPLQGGMAAVEDRMVDDFVQENGEVEHREALHERERYPHERVRRRDQRPRRERQDRELARRDEQMARGVFPVECDHLLARERAAELRPELDRVTAIVMSLHGAHWVSRQLY